MTSKEKEELVNGESTRDQLLKTVKAEVKRLMEEAVTKKFVHEGSSTVTSFCAAVEACLQYGLKKRTMTLFGSSSSQSTFALLERVARSFEPAARILKTAREAESSLAAAFQRQSSNGSVDGTSRSADYATLPRIFNWQSFTALSRTAIDSPPAHDVNGSRVSLTRQTSTPPNTPPCSPQLRYVWIRIALTEHLLDQIVQYIAKNAPKYYERQSVMADPVASTLLGSLLVGPCTLDFTKLKTCDHFLSDPPAEELIQRHRIHSNSLFHSGSLAAQSRFSAVPHSRAASSCASSKRPSLHIRKRARHASSSSSGEDFFSPFGGSLNLSGAAVSGAAKDYIEALHQNSRTTLLYGKNNVRVQLKFLDKLLTGYLQVHQTGENSLLLKWTPNQLMNASVCENGVRGDEPAELNALVEKLMNEPEDAASTGATPTPAPDYQQNDADANSCTSADPDASTNAEASGSVDADADDSTSVASQRSLLERSSRSQMCTSPFVSSTASSVSQSASRASPNNSTDSSFSLTPERPRAVAPARPYATVNTPSLRSSYAVPPSEPRETLLSSGCPDKQSVANLTAGIVDNSNSTRNVLRPSLTKGRQLRRLAREQSASLLEEIAKFGRRRLFWKYALTIPFDDVVYIHCHCHQQIEDHDSVVLVGKDGAQYPPFHFPKGGHLLQFLSCIDAGLQQAGGYIDPPLSCDENGIESFPRLRRRSSLLRSETSSTDAAGTEVRDYVFRIVHAHVVYQYSDDEDCSALTFTAGRGLNGVGTDATRTPSSTGIATMTTASVSPASVATSIAAGGASTVTNGSAHTLANGDVSANDVANATSIDAAVDVLCDAAPESPHDLIRQLCETMRGQLLSRAFYGWLEYTRHIKTVRKHLSELVNQQIIPNDSPCDARRGLTSEVWRRMRPVGSGSKNSVLQVPLDEVRRFVYYGGCAHEVRRQVWPYLLGHYRGDLTIEERESHDKQVRIDYEQTVGEWLAIEAIVQQREKEQLEAFLTNKKNATAAAETVSLENDVFDRQQAATGTGGSSYTSPLHHRGSLSSSPTGSLLSLNEDAEGGKSQSVPPQPAEEHAAAIKADTSSSNANASANVIVQVSADSSAAATTAAATKTAAASREKDLLSVHGEGERATESPGMISNSKESLVSLGSPASNGDVYRRALIDDFGMNLHRIDKDVQRCDRNHPYFADQKNLEKLRHIMCSYVWKHLDMGYAQGMCDLVAPLLVVLDDEALTYSCYSLLMERMVSHFPREGAPQAILDTRFASMRSLVQILDSELFDLMQRNGDYTHFFFAYRWFLLDFKRELAYEDVFAVWECIWSAPAVSTPHFVLFVALALVQLYREIIIDNNMDFTDIIRFFNEMAEKHDARQLLFIARYLVYQLQNLIQNC